MSDERSICEDCGLEFEERELDVDGLCVDCRLDPEEEEEFDVIA